MRIILVRRFSRVSHEFFSENGLFVRVGGELVESISKYLCGGFEPADPVHEFQTRQYEEWATTSLRHGVHEHRYLSFVVNEANQTETEVCSHGPASLGDRFCLP